MTVDKDIKLTDSNIHDPIYRHCRIARLSVFCDKLVSLFGEGTLGSFVISPVTKPVWIIPSMGRES
jgi:hypothetical protein